MVGACRNAAEQVQGERVAFHVFDQFLELIYLLGAVTAARVCAAFTPKVLSRCTPASRDRRSSFTSGAVVCQNARRSGMRISGGDDAQAVAGGGQPFEQRGDALVLEFARRGRGGRVLQRLEAVEDEQAAPLAHDAGQALAFLERAGGAGGEFIVRVVAEEGEGFLEEQVGGSGHLLARALAVEGPRKDGVAAGPVLMRQFRGPLGDERGFPFAAEGDEGEDVRALCSRRELCPTRR